MSIRPFLLPPTEGRYYREQDIPESCPALCATDRSTVGRVMVYSLWMALGMPTTRRRLDGRLVPAVADVGLANAHWFYFDQYGCRTTGLDVVSRSDAPLVTVYIKHILDEPQPLAVYWAEAFGLLAAAGAPRPATIERITPVRDVLWELARERDE